MVTLVVLIMKDRYTCEWVYLQKILIFPIISVMDITRMKNYVYLEDSEIQMHDETFEIDKFQTW